jgi:hypothetical protein
MYRSTSFAGQKSRSAFLEMSVQSAKAARLLSQAHAAQPEQGHQDAQTTVPWPDRLLKRLGGDRTPREVPAIR